MTTQCFALQPDGTCKALTVQHCPGTTCTFYKTKAQQARALKRSERRIARLSARQQAHIREKYFTKR